MQKYMYLAFTVVLLGFMAVLMLGPNLPDSQQREHCVYNIHLTGPFGFSLNCDSPLFMQLSNDPAQILEKNNVRQDRPGFIFLTASIAKFYTIIYPPAEREEIQQQAINVGRINNTEIIFPLAWLVHYVAYITVNVLIILLSFHCFLRISCTEKKYPACVGSIGLLLIFNDVVKAFIWSPHTQMFNILLPLFCLWCFLEVLQGDLFNRPAIFAFSLVAGVGVTMYGSFYLFLPAVLLPALLQFLKKHPSTHLLRFVLTACTVILLVTLPAWLWVLYVEKTTGSFYSSSTELYHHVIWMKDVWHEGIFLLITRLAQNFWNLTLLAARQGWIVIVLLLVLLSRSTAKRLSWRSLLSVQLVACLFTSAMFLFFFAMVGLITPRVAFTAIPPFIAYTAYMAQQQEQPRDTMTIFLTVITACYGVFELLKFGPYS